ncbi:efflux RND transporter periplasmic adaptor subunit [Mesorhizobium sp. M1A.F.Ca.IN.022.07.1.1]|uniref:efflux RND transporter periplasmic adaptor subunit n=1 Tax=unclassified Mesorhizobium TaxID=325217 RepID=UPI000FCB8656|nr:MULTISPECIES: efflux RND transporter periplasmic adaptor subunit [unclassified Mesorhizobium]TGV93678.1 efflux RND transporter periplasmic adaptor subunit [Mesorhizobium sp. M00.F.Ca.ET.158.01.1.1]RUV26809.1 efflux RND transporter periplasmic adaptor subunit [Mesorhizobium sp. M1A.F.Ca.IN.022.04.1.1]RUV97929.1 efflux RND transporter periplasmic adaptor subunit [Mesorhizobium sp. M1A.F.Ca.IN.022.07.1.1]RWG37586.1 MAG: efflux RND transporter periplasmic adaptor subunit [Mesorhizobium sp.]RWG5
MPIQPSRYAPGARLSLVPPTGLFCAVMVLAGCTQQSATSAPPGGAPARPQVGVVTVHPQSVAITAELPGRTVASLVAEVRPQVDGIIQSRLFKEGSEVAKGDELYQIDPASYQASYDSAIATEQKAEAAVPSAQAKFDRYAGLISQNAVSKQDYDDAAASLAQAKAEVASAKASVETARINLAYTKIIAPIAGRVDKSSLTPGALVTANQTDALTTIRTLDPINIDVTESSTNLLNLRQAIAEGRLKFNGEGVSVKLKLENGTIYSQTGKMEFAEANVSETTGTFALRAQFPNPDRLLLPGMYVRAIVEAAVAPNSYLVPQRGVTRNTKGEPTAMVVNADGKVEQRILSVRNSVGNDWLVDQGISDGERIIVEGTQLVKAGAEATPVEVTIDPTTGEVKEHQSSAAPAPVQAADSGQKPAQGASSSN